MRSRSSWIALHEQAQGCIPELFGIGGVERVRGNAAEAITPVVPDGCLVAVLEVVAACCLEQR